MDLQVNNFLNILNAAVSNNITELIEPDWMKLYGFSRHHSMIPLLTEGCNKYEEYQLVPEEIKNKLLLESIETIMWQAQRTEAFLSVYDKLIEAGLKPLVIKGLICRNTYGELADHRPSGDEDIYIKIDEFDLVKDILVSNGYQMQDIKITDELLSKVQEISFYHTLNDLHIEVHLNPMGKETKHREKMNHYFKDAFDTCVCYEINGHQIYTLNCTAHFLFLFLHFYRHFTSAGVGIRQVIDILMYDRKYHREINWSMVENIIKDMSAAKLYSDILELGRRYLGFQLDTTLKGFDYETLLEDLIVTGTFGNSTRDQALSSNVTTSAMNNNGLSILKTIFPKASTLTKGYPVLFRRPYLLPFVWVIRLFKFFFFKDGSDSKMLQESIKIGKRRVQLLKNYGIIS